jgi:uncharacterized Zn-binding protein involved in type VI secretion
MKKNQIYSILSLIIMSVMIFILLWIISPEVFSSTAKPAARLGDRTAHGGSIIVGCSTVLIGGQPAARVGDMHVCPMVTPGLPPIPHAGGPIIMGSPTVFIGGMPAARMTDLAVCTGPLDVIISGCPNVLIGVGGASKPNKYGLKYIKSRYKKSVVITKQEFKRRKLKKDNQK